MRPLRVSSRSASVDVGVGASVGTVFTLGGLRPPAEGTVNRGAPALIGPGAGGAGSADAAAVVVSGVAASSDAQDERAKAAAAAQIATRVKAR